ncbi:SGNH/GDSL hydrolase family protein [Glycomyces arizonensis]|uniref:SGNH/GDSL hydrolase family protein n=1 Tax=Glycomyces arizonensis TaxID=256035 RepID=UPI00047A476C|nr:SGNH/GDSL hydrolase family protein [Glycomyces arizonensis]
MRPGKRAATVVVAAGAALLLLPAASAQAWCFDTDYVALGDSYSSGTGAGPYLDEECLRSEQAYPSLLAGELRGDFDFAACSGAETEDLLANQLGDLSWRTDLVTVGIGGNDIGWVPAVGACMQPETYDCTPAVEAAVAAMENELPALLDEVYTEIEDRAPFADVYVVGYPRLFNGEGPCESIPYVTADEQVLMNGAADVLSNVIEAEAEEHGFTFVDVREAFEGHVACDEDSWLHGYTGTVESFHPTVEGQESGYYAALTAAL